MPAFFLALLLAALASFCRRDQLLVAHLSARLGQSGGLPAVAWLAACMTAGIAAFAGSALASIMPGPAKQMLVAFALLLGAAETLWPWKVRRPKEPTRSLFAIFIVLMAQQIGDGARFLILALAVALANPVLPGIGGAMGSGAALTMGWILGGDMDKLPLRTIRYVLAAAMALAGIVIGLSARGIIG